MEILNTGLFLLIGFLAVYFKSRDLYNRYLASIQKRAVTYITEAESEYTGLKQGSKRMAFVVDALYEFLPSWIRVVFTKERLQEIAQDTFDEMEKFAMEFLDKKLNGQ